MMMVIRSAHLGIVELGERDDELAEKDGVLQPFIGSLVAVLRLSSLQQLHLALQVGDKARLIQHCSACPTRHPFSIISPSFDTIVPGCFHLLKYFGPTCHRQVGPVLCPDRQGGIEPRNGCSGIGIIVHMHSSRGVRRSIKFTTANIVAKALVHNATNLRGI